MPGPGIGSAKTLGTTKFKASSSNNVALILITIFNNLILFALDTLFHL